MANQNFSVVHSFCTHGQSNSWRIGKMANLFKFLILHSDPLTGGSKFSPHWILQTLSMRRIMKTQLPGVNGHWANSEFMVPRLSSCPTVLQNLQEMNGRRSSSYKELVASYADCHRKVFPVINTCLDNITEASNSVNPEQVSLWGCAVTWCTCSTM